MTTRAARMKLSEYIVYLQSQQTRFENDPEICWVDWLVRPEAYQLGNGEISIAEEHTVTPAEADNRFTSKVAIDFKLGGTI